MGTRRETIMDTIADMVSDLLYYDRKEDGELPQGAIEEAIEASEITEDEIVRLFRDKLADGLELP